MLHSGGYSPRGILLNNYTSDANAIWEAGNIHASLFSGGKSMLDVFVKLFSGYGM